MSICIVIKLNTYLADSTNCMVKHLENEYNISCPMFCKTILLTMDMVCFHIHSVEKCLILFAYKIHGRETEVENQMWFLYILPSYYYRKETLISPSLALCHT